MALASPLPVTVVIPTLNEEDRLLDCLRSVRWAAEVIVADAGSTDATATIARHFGARVIEVPGVTIAGQRNAAMAIASQPWVLALDADERVTAELIDAIAAAIASPSADAYRIRFRNQYLGAPMERGGWGRDKHHRFSRASLRWGVKQVHESLDYDGPIVDLDGVIEHDSYRNLEHQLRKVMMYSRWGAEDLHRRGVRAGISHLAIRPFWRFVKCYLLQGAWREGHRGLVLAAVHAWSAFAKYAVLWDIQRQADSAVRSAPARSARIPDLAAVTATFVADGEQITSVA